jgi:hypothetical protein
MPARVFLSFSFGAASRHSWTDYIQQKEKAKRTAWHGTENLSILSMENSKPPVIATRSSVLSEKLPSQRARDDQNTFDSMPVNSESISNEIDESNSQLKNHFGQKS